MFQRLSADEVSRHRGMGRGANPEYVQFLSSLQVGEGGQIDVAAAGVSRQSVKKRLERAAADLGRNLKFLRSGEDLVVFELVDAPTVRRRGRPRKNQAGNGSAS